MSTSQVSLRRYPFPFRAALAVNNDTDGMTWEAFEDWHTFVNGTGTTTYGQGLGLEVGDGFWVWSSRGEFALQHRAPWDAADIASPESDRIKELVQLGWLDTLHGFGDWEQPYQLTAHDMARSFDYLDRLGAFPSVYVNHGGGQHRGYNVGGPWGTYHGADDPKHLSYCLPELLKRGTRFIWIDKLFENDKFGENLLFREAKSEGQFWQSYNFKRWTSVVDGGSHGKRKVRNILPKLTPIKCKEIQQFLSNNIIIPTVGRDGNVFLAFKRFRGNEAPTVGSFALQVTSQNLDHLENRQGVVIVYQHFGVWRALGRPKGHESQRASVSPVLDENAVWAWRDIAARQRTGSLFVTTVSRLLNYLHTRDSLRFRIEKRKKELKIIITRLSSEVNRKSPLSAESLEGIGFLVNKNESDVKVRIEGERANLPFFRVPDPLWPGKHVVHIPWRRKKFPVASRLPRSGRRNFTYRESIPPPQSSVASSNGLTKSQAQQFLKLITSYVDHHVISCKLENKGTRGG